MQAQVFWINTEPAHRLAILARPRGGDWLAGEARSWRDQGVDIVVSMLTAAEADEFDLAEEAAACTATGMEYINVPVADRGVPASRDQFAALVARLTDRVARGKAVGIHCRAGVGRSAMLAASLLIAAGLSPADAFGRARAARGCPVPDTPEQRAWVERSAVGHPVKAS